MPSAGALRHGCGCRLGPPSALQAHCLPAIPGLRGVYLAEKLAEGQRWPKQMDLEGA